ncbi:RidA family protein [Mycobacteroides abscessus subsp. massiliense]|uniref:RidA family protein n=1 Tax=Mycobacteroides abscessus TaxID=36809 RepID=UPI00266BA4BC|nr:RidA family protein [Mycobacteroides abscessus]MDO3297428.1 RidA family protein [Mycobacteroides abscessus subsp. massiliense]
MTMRPITNDQAPEPFGAYSPAARIGNLVQVSGQIGFDRATAGFAAGNAYRQTVQALNNVRTLLQEADLDLADLLMLRVYAAAAEDFPAINEAFQDVLVEPYPARTTLFGGLPAGVLVEIDGLAVAADV